MLREYEFTMITSAQLAEADMSALLKKYEDLLTAGGGVVVQKDEWGVLRLAYPIKKQFKGRYICYKLATTHTAIAAAEKLMRIDQNILRYLNIKLSNTFDPSSVPVSSAEDTEAESASPAEDSKESSAQVSTQDTSQKASTENKEEVTKQDSSEVGNESMDATASAGDSESAVSSRTVKTADTEQGQSEDTSSSANVDNSAMRSEKDNKGNDSGDVHSEEGKDKAKE